MLPPLPYLDGVSAPSVASKVAASFMLDIILVVITTIPALV